MNKDEFWSKFKHGVQEFKGDLPEGVLAIMVNDDFGDTSALLLSMESKDKTYRELNDYMNALIDSLRMVPSVGKMTVHGLQKEQISIYLNSDKLSHYGISHLLIAQQLKAKGFVTTAGRLKANGYKSPIYVDHALNKIYDVENTLVYTDAEGNNVRLKDLATVKREYVKASSFISNNGTKCILLSVEIKKGQDVSKMGAEVNKKLANFKKTIPDDVQLTTITDQKQVVDDSISNFLHELMIAITTVILVVILIMPMRVALVAAGTMPITIFIDDGRGKESYEGKYRFYGTLPEVYLHGYTLYLRYLLPVPRHHEGTDTRLPAFLPLGNKHRAVHLYDYSTDPAAYPAVRFHKETYRSSPS